MNKNLFLSKFLLTSFVFLIFSSSVQKVSFADCAPSSVFGGEGDLCCGLGVENDLQCNGGSCQCNVPYVCLPPETGDADPVNWRCRFSCGGIGEDCCLTSVPEDKCDVGLACYNQGGSRTCRNCGVVSGPCCVIGDQCGVDGEGKPLIPVGSGEACVCEEEDSPPIACGTDGYPCCLEDGSDNVIGACDAGDSPCTCSEGTCKDGAGPINISYSTHCFVAEECGAEGQNCCEAPEPPCDGAPLICSSGKCCVDENGDGVCDGSNNQPGEPVKTEYKGPIIEVLSDIINPIAKILYFGGLFIGISFIIYAGYRLMMSQGNPQVTKDAQEQLTAAILGIMFILLSAGILRIILKTIIGAEDVSI
ncbi:pilin [Patescibacteria group bacterium]|nr:pilin [Patescibacteria group bacterium]